MTELITDEEMAKLSDFRQDKAPELQAWVGKLNAMTPPEIRKFMQEEKITGVPKSAGRCVIANFIRDKLELALGEVGVDTQVIDIFYLRMGSTGVTPSDTLATFIMDFDFGEYPELEDSNIRGMY